MDTRNSILSKALSLFASRGYDAVGVQEVVDTAGVTKPTLYHYFGSKLGLFRVVLQDHFEKLNRNLTVASEYNGDLPMTLRKIAGACFLFSKQEPVFYRLQLSLYFAPHESDAFKEVVKLNKELFRLIEEVFLLACRDQGNMKGRHRLYAASFLGMINNCIGLALNGLLTLDDELLERAVHQFEHGIYS